mmetsp:Transcript_23664/g.33218  ORF Transcript_23664/g.33218 Transcript_23664/m.33218 type:complete len:441 (-) Transcript_23664:2416-3738(-)
MARPLGFIMDSSREVKSVSSQVKGAASTTASSIEEQAEINKMVGSQPVASIGTERILPTAVDKQDTKRSGIKTLKSSKASSASRLTDILKSRKTTEKESDKIMALDKKPSSVRRVIRRHSSSSLETPKKLSDIVEDTSRELSSEKRRGLYPSMIPMGITLSANSLKPSWKSSSSATSATSSTSSVASTKPKRASSSAYDLDLSSFKSTSSDPGNLDKQKKNNRVSRNCTSDTNLINSRLSSRCSSGGNLSNYNSRSRLSVSLVQRSSGQGAKELIERIWSKIDQFQKCTSDEEAATCIPFDECSTLAHFAEDGYYRVVISASNGIQAILLAMTTFPNHLGVQKACCTAIGNLCHKNGGNQLLVSNTGGIGAILNAMEIHSSSIVVQSFACDALFHLKHLMVSLEEENLTRAVEYITRARAMYLMPGCKEHAEQLLEFLNR